MRRSILRFAATTPRPEAATSHPDNLPNYDAKYKSRGRRRLSRKYDTLTDKNRFESLRLILDRLSGHYGRRQYKYRQDMKSLVQRFEGMSLDWQDLKALAPEEFRLISDSMRLNAAERTILATALHSKACGVLTEGTTSASPQSLCFRHGVEGHRWRCGVNGHESETFFEHKVTPTAAPTLTKTQVVENGIVVDTRPQPDFVIEGRLSEEIVPRTWSAPKDARFNVMTMGFDFRVHPEDPRARIQISDHAHLWERHSEVVRVMLWEMLETFATETGTAQPYDIRVGDFVQDTAITPHGTSPEGKYIEYRMMDADGTVRPFFMAPKPQPFHRGVPTFMPFAPSVIVRSVYHFPTPGTIDTVPHPRLQIQVLSHGQACFKWNKDNEDKAMQYLLEYARKVPYTLPFFLYFRVDPMSMIKHHPEFVTQRQELYDKNCWAFDLRNFVENRAKL
eukprot:PhM_4_TR77/c0_g1_i1/m.42108